jgi:bifunctional ADP-heptose synthase (sugar kinase/adenylyltransferase)
LGIGAGVTLASKGILLGDYSKGNIKKLSEIEDVYKKYKSGMLARGQYMA